MHTWDLLVSPLEHYSLQKNQLRYWEANLTSDPEIQKTWKNGDYGNYCCRREKYSVAV